MNYKTVLSAAALAIVGVVIGFIFNYQSQVIPLESDATSHAETTYTTMRATADWGDVPTSVDALYEAADVVIRVSIIDSDQRLLSQTLANYQVVEPGTEDTVDAPLDRLILEQGMRERGISGSPEELSEVQIQTILSETTLEMEQVGEHTVYTPFTDSTVRVVEVFKGKIAQQEIVVLQLGGLMPAPNSDSAELSALMEFAENPFLQVGEEYILFLNDSSENELHAQGRALYELVAPTGQFHIVGSQLNNPYAVHEEYGADALPTNLDDLLVELERR